MMDVMQVQKINALALDLMKQGLATARDQAVVMAEQMLARKDYTKLTTQMDGIPTSSPERAHEAQQQASATTNLDQQTIQTILEKNSEFLVKKIKDFQEQITKLETQLKEVQSQVQSRNTLIREVPSRSEHSMEDSQQKLRAAQSVSSSNHPRSGNFSPGDVSIEKIFYTGSRKQ